MPELTLDKGIAVARQYEQVKEQSKIQEQMQHSAMSVLAVPSYPVRGHRRSRGRGQYSRSRRDTTTLSDRRTFEKCGRYGYGHTQDRRCPASGQTCRKCQKTGHFARVCRKKALHEVANVSPTTSTTAAQFCLDSIITDNLQ